jgi:hypothetical protein
MQHDDDTASRKIHSQAQDDHALIIKLLGHGVSTKMKRAQAKPSLPPLHCHPALAKDLVWACNI